MSKAQDILKALAGDVGIGGPTVTPSIPNVPNIGDANLRQFLSALKQIIETREGERGDALDSSVTWRDLINKQFAKIDLTNRKQPTLDGIIPNASDGTIDYTPPPAPTNLVASGALATVILDWDTPTYTNHAYAEIWRSSTNNIGTAQMIGMAPGAAYADSVGSGQSHYYWIRYVSKANVTGPFNKTEGTLGETSVDPGYILKILNGQITTSELASSLNSRIDLVDAPATTPGSVAYQVLQEAQARGAAISSEATARQDADTSLANSITTLTASVNSNAAAIQTEATTRADADTAISNSITTLASTVNTNYSTLNSAIQTEQTARTDADTALSNSITTLQSTVNTNNTNLTASIQSEATARSNADTALGSRIDTVQATVTSNNTTLSAAVQTEATARAEADGTLFAQYTVKTDVNGYVSGFGLASTLNNATPFSQFIFKADQFAFGAPGLTSAYPFVIQATATTVNGVAVPAGVYIDAAYIKNGTITSAKIGTAAIDSAKIADAAIVTAKIADATITTAKIGDAQITNAKIANLSAEKITAGTISADRIGANSVTADKIDSRNLTIKDAAGNIVFSAANNLDWSRISGTGKAADNATVGATFGVNIGGQITGLNASTYIADAAIQTAQIANAAIGSAKIADGAITNAKIGDAQITAAKIASLALVGANNFDVKTGYSGARMEMNNQVIKVFDANGVLRVRIGNLYA